MTRTHTRTHTHSYTLTRAHACDISKYKNLIYDTKEKQKCIFKTFDCFTQKKKQSIAPQIGEFPFCERLSCKYKPKEITGRAKKNSQLETETQQKRKRKDGDKKKMASKHLIAIRVSKSCWTEF